MKQYKNEKYKNNIKNPYESRGECEGHKYQTSILKIT